METGPALSAQEVVTGNGDYHTRPIITGDFTQTSKNRVDERTVGILAYGKTVMTYFRSAAREHKEVTTQNSSC